MQVPATRPHSGLPALRAVNVLMLAILAIVSLCAPARGAIWGVKSHDPITQPPVTLFHFAENGVAFNTVGVVHNGTQQIDVDGLAMSPQADLYGFEVNSGGSTLVRISKTTASASSVGPVLPGMNIRGAVFCISGKLAALDATSNKLVCVNPSTGELIGSALSLTLNGQPFDVPDCTDIAQRADGLLLIAGGAGNTIYSMDAATGKLSELFTDPNPDEQGYLLFIAGLAFSRSASLFGTLFAYDVSMTDDIFAYDTEALFARTTLFPDIIPSYNAGRGDLAAQLDPPISFGITNRAAVGPAAQRGSFLYRFVVWGVVRDAGVDSFYLDDGSGHPAKIVAAGYSGIGNGDYARAEGVLHDSAEGPILLCSPEDITLVEHGI